MNKNLIPERKPLEVTPEPRPVASGPFEVYICNTDI